jgi:tetratricopeptide (TPR) repeat protein
MLLKTLCTILSLSPLACSIALAQDEPVPDRAVVRRQIDTLIANAPNHRATLGTLEAAMALSISYGAPAWNALDHEACSNFYVKTGESLCTAFAGADTATVPARQILDDLKSAVARVKLSNDADANAWTMRFVFDKTEVDVLAEADRSVRLLALGQECASRGQFQDSANAFATATDVLHELDGGPIDQIPAACRYAPVALSDSLFAQKKYKESAAAAEEGLHFVPELPDQQMDLSKHFGDPALYRVLADDLHEAAASHPDDPALQLLTGYHLYFTNQRNAAKAFFEKALKLEPKDAGAKRMLEQYDPSRPKPPVGNPPPAAVGA